MHAKPILHTLLLIFILTILGACSMGNVDSAQLDGDTLKITSGKDLFLLQICRPDLLNVDYRYKGESSPDTPVLDSNAKWDTGNITSSALHSDPMVIKTTKMTVKISKKPCRLAIYDPAGNLLLKEQNSEGVYKDGVKFTHNNPHANFYGISGYDAWENSAAGIIRNSGGSVYAGQQGHCAAPMVFTANYGLLVDSDGGKFTIDHTKLEFSGVRKKPQDSKEIPKKNFKYYIAVGPPKSVLSAMSAVTGRPPMLPRWAMGFMNSEWGIDQKELASHVNSYRAKGIPIDAYILDFDYKDWGGGDFGEFKWNHANFPDGADGVLKANMDKVGIKLCGIMKPRLVIKNPDDTLTKQAQFINAKEQSEGGWWYPGLKAYLDYTSDVYHRPIWCKDVNFANANVRKWFWEQTKHFFATGIRGYWNDEADNVSAKNDFKFNFDNFQFLNMQRALYEGQKSATNLRVWSTNRNYYMGAQRYAYTMWSGDLPQGFESMAKQRERLLSAVNVGQVKWGMDIGGFAQTPTPQNYARWVQFGAFIPLFRVHGEKDEQRQPWKYGLTGENAVKEAIRLRYALIPYIYHYERTAFEAGVGLDRPLFYQYPHDAKVAKAIDAWLFGDYFMIAPVVAENQTSKQIYLPKGTAWVDFFRGKSYNGGTTVTYPLNPIGWNDIPVFVRKGAIIPWQKPPDYIGQKPVSTIYVNVFPDASPSDFEYYEDDGLTYAYEDGAAFFKQKMSVQDRSAAGIHFRTGAKTGAFTPNVQYYIVKIHGRAGKKVTVNGRSIKNYSQSLTTQGVFIKDSLADLPNEGWTIGTDVYGDFTCVKIAAGTPKDIVIIGNQNPNVQAIRYEAEKALLWADTESQKPSVAHSAPAFSGSGYITGAGKPSAAASFTLNSRTGGAYNVVLRYENGEAASSEKMNIYVNGRWIQALPLPATSRNTWKNKVATLPLAAGRNTITFQCGDTKAKLDYIIVPLFPQVTRYEAESGVLSGGMGKNNNHFHYTGWGFADKIETLGAKLTFKVSVPASGTYNIAVRYANAKRAPRTLSLLVNGVKKQLKFPVTANWDTWKTVSAKATLPKGENTLALQYGPADNGAINIDHIQVSQAGTAPKTTFTENLTANGDFETGNIDGWREWHDSSISDAVYGVDSRDVYSGDHKCYFFKNTPYKQSIHQTIPARPGVYLFSARVKLSYNQPNIARVELQTNGSKTLLNIPPNGKWRHITEEIKINTAQDIDIGFYLDTPGNTSLQIDDVRLEKHQ